MNLHIMKASGRLANFEPKLIASFNEVEKRIEGKILLPNLDVVIVDNPNNVIPEIGIVGYAITANLVYINIDPDSSYFQTHVSEEVISHLTHELHHCVRMNTIGYGKTLLDAIVSEGLADHFDIEINAHKANLWSTALTEEQMKEELAKAALEFDSVSYDHTAWFFGSEEKNIPRWTGYSLGFELVRKYMEKSGKTAAELFDAPAKLFTE
jgi:uncharacterized protein YjaZ